MNLQAIFEIHQGVVVKSLLKAGQCQVVEDGSSFRTIEASSFFHDGEGTFIVIVSVAVIFHRVVDVADSIARHGGCIDVSLSKSLFLELQ